MGVMTTKFLGKFGEIVFILRNAFIYRGLRKFLGDCYTLSPFFISKPHFFCNFTAIFAVSSRNAISDVSVIAEQKTIHAEPSEAMLP